MNTNAPFLACAAITAISAVISLGFSVAAVRSSVGPARTASLYTAARSVALATIGVAPLATGAAHWLYPAAVAMIVVQGCDGVVGVTIVDRTKTFGPAGTALANLIALLWFLSQG